VASPSISPGQEERAEMEAVLHSGLFARAPNLESFFRYICEHHFNGRSEQLKEYNIAVEALGRSPQFDQKKDSIVRVEAHRLRKRLSEYYAGEAADHTIQIMIPRGSYAPQFLFARKPSSESAPTGRDEQAPVHTQELVPALMNPEPFVEPHVPSQSSSPWLGRSFWARLVWMILSVAILLTFLGLAKRQFHLGANAELQPRKEVGSPAGQAVSTEFRILAGYSGHPIMDGQGREWRQDAYYSGGRSMLLPEGLAIQELAGPRFFNTARTGDFQYNIPLNAGVFELHLYFAETEYGIGNPKGGGDGSRLFQLSINGRTQVDLFDVHAEAGGPNRLFIRVFKDISPAADGKIHISFSTVRGGAILNALEILPSEPGHIRPIRIVAQAHPVTDLDGQVWSADQFVVGGTLVFRRDAKFQNRDFVVYQGERYGNFTYHFPLAPGKYRLTLHFAETWFGTPNGLVSSHEHRLFDVYANGLALMRRFDVLHEAGAPNKGIQKVFDGLEPNAQGELNIQFIPLANYAEVNAIEVVETE
jgi:hypothetical protein